MPKKHLRLVSFIVQGMYSALCILDIVICLLYKNNFDTALGNKCARWALDLTGILFLLPAMPVGIILNVSAAPPKQTEAAARKRWIVWTMVSACLYVLFCFSAVCVFVATTGGV